MVTHVSPPSNVVPIIKASRSDVTLPDVGGMTIKADPREDAPPPPPIRIAAPKAPTGKPPTFAMFRQGLVEALQEFRDTHGATQ
jgi:hypothetical protein